MALALCGTRLAHIGTSRAEKHRAISHFCNAAVTFVSALFANRNALTHFG